MKFVIVAAHPSKTSFTLAAARVCGEAIEGLGHDVLVRDLYAMGFDPLLRETEIPRAGGFAPGEDVTRERDLLAGADGFVFVYPLWFYMPPAALVGYVSRVFGMGFGYGRQSGGGNAPLLSGVKLLSLTSSGAPDEWLSQEGTLTALERVFEAHLAGVCGLENLGHIHSGAMGPSSAPAFVEAALKRARSAVTARLGSAPHAP